MFSTRSPASVVKQEPKGARSTEVDIDAIKHLLSCKKMRVSTLAARLEVTEGAVQRALDEADGIARSANGWYSLNGTDEAEEEENGFGFK